MRNALTLKAVALTIIIALFTTLHSGCSNTGQPVQKSAFALDTVISLTLYNGNEELIDECFEMIAQYELIFSAKNTSSELYRLNEASGGVASDLLYDAISRALELSKISNGAFDIGLGALTALWDFNRARVPTQQEVEAALMVSGYENIRLLPDNRIEYLKEGLSIDLGAYAKGYIGELIADFLRESGVDSAIIALGGNITCIGSKGGDAFNVGIANPLPTGSGNISTLSITDRSVATSGSNERYFIDGGVKYHHILDPTTGYPADSPIASVTVIAPDADMADALSTAFFVLGIKDSVSLIERLGLSAVFVSNDGEITKIP